MKKHAYVASIAILIATISGVSCNSNKKFAPSSGTGPKVVLRMALKKGDQYIYDKTNRVSSNIAGQSVAITMHETLNTEILDFTDEGFSAKTTTKDVSIRSDNEPGIGSMSSIASSLEGTVSEISYDKYGTVLSSKATSKNKVTQSLGSGLGGLNIGFMGLQLPKGEVGVGAQWEATLDVKPLMDKIDQTIHIQGNSLLSIRYKLVSFDKEGSEQFAVIEQRTEGSLDAELAVSGQSKQMTQTYQIQGTFRVKTTNGVVVEIKQSSMTETKVDGRSVIQKIDTTVNLRK